MGPEVETMTQDFDAAEERARLAAADLSAAADAVIRRYRSRGKTRRTRWTSRSFRGGPGTTRTGSWTMRATTWASRTEGQVPGRV